MANLKPKKGDRAQFHFGSAPAVRYEDRWGTVVRANRKDGTIVLSYPTQRKTNMTVSISDLRFKRNGKSFWAN